MNLSRSLDLVQYRETPAVGGSPLEVEETLDGPAEEISRVSDRWKPARPCPDSDQDRPAA
jgi:hypothetical protein